MRRAAAPLVAIVGLIAVLAPSPAEASRGGLWEWLEQLSGPGPFEGHSVTIPLLCSFVGAAQDTPIMERLQPGYKCLVPPLSEKARIAADARGLTTRRATLGFVYARLSTDDNPLQYAEPPAEPGVRWTKFGPVFTWHPTVYMDVHTSVEWNRLASKGALFSPIWVTSIELVGITWHPVAAGPRPLRGLAIPIRAKMLTRSLDAAEFGAIPGTFRTGREVQLQVGIVYDLWGLR